MIVLFGIEVAHPLDKVLFEPILRRDRAGVAAGPVLVVSHEDQVVARGGVRFVVPVRIVEGHGLCNQQTLAPKVACSSCMNVSRFALRADAAVLRSQRRCRQTCCPAQTLSSELMSICRCGSSAIARASKSPSHFSSTTFCTIGRMRTSGRVDSESSSTRGCERQWRVGSSSVRFEDATTRQRPNPDDPDFVSEIRSSIRPSSYKTRLRADVLSERWAPECVAVRDNRSIARRFCRERHVLLSREHVAGPPAPFCALRTWIRGQISSGFGFRSAACGKPARGRQIQVWQERIRPGRSSIKTAASSRNDHGKEPAIYDESRRQRRPCGIMKKTGDVRTGQIVSLWGKVYCWSDVTKPRSEMARSGKTLVYFD